MFINQNINTQHIDISNATTYCEKSFVKRMLYIVYWFIYLIVAAVILFLLDGQLKVFVFKDFYHFDKKNINSYLFKMDSLITTASGVCFCIYSVLSFFFYWDVYYVWDMFGRNLYKHINSVVFWIIAAKFVLYVYSKTEAYEVKKYFMSLIHKCESRAFKEVFKIYVDDKKMFDGDFKGDNNDSKELIMKLHREGLIQDDSIDSLLAKLLQELNIKSKKYDYIDKCFFVFWCCICSVKYCYIFYLVVSDQVSLFAKRENDSWKDIRVNLTKSIEGMLFVRITDEDLFYFNNTKYDKSTKDINSYIALVVKNGKIISYKCYENDEVVDCIKLSYYSIYGFTENGEAITQAITPEVSKKLIDQQNSKNNEDETKVDTQVEETDNMSVNL